MLIRSSAYLKKLRKGKRKQFRPRIESLESRQLLAAVIWDAEGDGTSFSDPLNWSGDAVPGQEDDVTIDLDGGGTPYNILVNSNQQVRSLRIENQDAQVQLSAGVFTTDTITIDSGRLVSTGGDIVATSIVNQDRFALGRTVDLDVEEIVNHASFVIQSSSTSTVSIDGTLRNHGEFGLNSSGTSGGTLSVENGNIINEVGGTITIGGPDTRAQNVRAAFENLGELTFRGSNINFGDGDDFITNQGSVTVESGTRFATFDSQTVINQQAGVFVVDGDVLLDNGTLNVTGGEVVITDLLQVDNNGLINVSGGVVRNDGILQLNQRGTFDFSGGDIVGTEPVQIFGTVALNITGDGSFDAQTRGSTTVSGKLLTGQSLSVIRGNSGLEFTPGFTNEGTIEFTNPEGSAQSISTTDDSSFQNLPGGTVRFTRTNSFTAIGTFIQSPIDNAGTMIVDTIVFDSKLNELKNTGTFEITPAGRYSRSSSGSGTVRPFLQAGGTLTNDGRFDGNGLTLEYTGGDAFGTFTPRDLILASGSGGSGVFSPTNSLAGDVQPGQTVVVDSPNIDINSDVSNEGAIRFVPPADGTQASLFVNNSVFSNLAGGEITFEAAVGQSAFVFGSIINEGEIRVTQGAARIDGILNRDQVIVEENATLFQRVNTAFVQEAGTLDLTGEGLFKGLFDYRGGNISGVPHVSDGGSLAVAEGLPASEYLLTEGGDFESNLPAEVTVTISNRGAATNIDSYDAISDFVVNGVLVIGDAESTGQRIDLDVPGTLTIGPTGSITTSGIESRIESTLTNEGAFRAQALTTVTEASATHVNRGELTVVDDTLRFFGDGLTNEVSGTVGGTGGLFLDDGSFGFRPTTFVNAGTVAAGQSPGLLTITATNSLIGSTGKVIAEIDGTTPATEFDVLTFVGDVSLDGQLEVVTAPNFTPFAGATFEILSADGITGGFANVSLTGNPAAFYSAVTSAESVTLTSVIAETDLAVELDQVPGAAVSTQPISVSYTVTNQGLPTEIENWTDRLYLSPTEEFHIATAQLVAEIPHQGNLATSESYSETVNVDLPAALPGVYHLILISDSRLQTADADRNNNRVASAGLPVSVDTIPFDRLELVAVESESDRLLKLIVPPGTDFSVTTESTVAGSHELFVLKDDVPSPSRFDRKAFQADSADNTITLSSEELATFFVLISERESAVNPIDVSVLATELPLTVENVSPDAVGNDGAFTLTVEGAGFDATSEVDLISFDGTIVEALQVRVDNSNRLQAVFDLNEQPTGAFDVRVTSGDDSSTLNEAVAVFETNPGRTVSVLNAPAVIRNLREASLSIETTNAGNTDAPAALQTLLIPDVNIRLSESDEFTPDIIEFLVTDPSSASDALAPGVHVSTEINFQQLISSTVVPISLQTPDLALELDHFAVIDDLRPETFSVEDWSAVYEQYAELVGETYGEYQEALGSAAADLKSLGIPTADVAKLRAYLFVIAGADAELAQQLRDGTAQPSDVSAALEQLARPLSLSAIVRREGGDRVSALQTAAFTFSIDRATSQTIDALNEQLGEAFSAALSDQELADLEFGIEAIVTDGGFTQLDSNVTELLSAITSDDLQALEAFRNTAAARRAEIQQVMDAIRGTTSELLDDLGQVETDQLRRGINQSLVEGQTVSELLQDVSESPADAITAFRTQVAEQDAATVVSQLSADFVATQTQETLANLQAGIVVELLKGVDVDVFAEGFSSASVSLIDLLIADETQEERDVELFFESMRLLGLDEFLGDLTSQQFTELSEIVRQAARQSDDSRLADPERFAKAILAGLAEGTRAALDAASRQLEVNQVLNEVIQEDPTGNFAGLDRNELDLVADRIDDSIRKEPAVDVVRDEGRQRAKEALLAEAPDVSEFVRELEINNLLDQAFKDFDIGFLERELIEERLRKDLEIDLDQLAEDPDFAAALLEDQVVLAERIIGAGQADDLNEAVERLGLENKADNLIFDAVNLDNDLEAVVDNLDVFQRDELVKFVADELDKVPDSRANQLIPVIQALLQNGEDAVREFLDESRAERNLNAVLNLLQDNEDFDPVLDVLNEKERDGLERLIQEEAPDDRFLRDFADIIANRLGGIDEAAAIKRALADFEDQRDAKDFIDELEQDPLLGEILDALDADQKQEFQRQLAEDFKNGQEPDLDQFREAFLEADTEAFGDRLNLIRAGLELDEQLNELAENDPEIGRAVFEIDADQRDVVKRFLANDENALERLREIGRLPLDERNDALDRLAAEQAAADAIAENPELAGIVDQLDPEELREFEQLVADAFEAARIDPRNPLFFDRPPSIEDIREFLRVKATERQAKELIDEAAANNEVNRALDVLSADAINELIQSLVDRLNEGVTSDDVKDEIQAQEPQDLNETLEQQSKDRAVLDYRAALEAIPAVGTLFEAVIDLSTRVDADIAVAIEAGVPFVDFADFVVQAGDGLRDQLEAAAPDRDADQFLQEVAAAGAQAITDALTDSQAGEFTAQALERNLFAQSLEASGFIDAVLLAPIAVAGQLAAQGTDVVQAALDADSEKRQDDQFLQDALNFEGGATLQTQISQLSDRAKAELAITVRETRDSSGSVTTMQQILLNGADSDGGLNSGLEQDSFRRQAIEALDVVGNDPDGEAALLALTPEQITEYQAQLEQFFNDVTVLQDIGFSEFSSETVGANQLDELKNNFNEVQASLQESLNKKADDQLLEAALNLEGGEELRAQIPGLSDRAKAELDRTVQNARANGFGATVLRDILLDEAASEGGLNNGLEQGSFRTQAIETLTIVGDDPDGEAALLALTPEQITEYREQLEQFFSDASALQDLGFSEFSAETVGANQLDELKNNFDEVQTSLQESLDKKADDELLEAALDLEGGEELRAELPGLSDRAKAELERTVRNTRNQGLDAAVLRNILLEDAASAGGLNGGLEQDSFRQQVVETLTVVGNDPDGEAALLALTPEQITEYQEQLEQFFSNVAALQDVGFSEFSAETVGANQLDELKNNFNEAQASLQESIDKKADDQLLDAALDFEGGEALREQIAQLSGRAKSELDAFVRESREGNLSATLLRQLLSARAASEGGLNGSLESGSFTRSAFETLDLILQDPIAESLSTLQLVELRDQLDQFFESVAAAQDRGFVEFSPASVAANQIQALREDAAGIIVRDIDQSIAETQAAAVTQELNDAGRISLDDLGIGQLDTLSRMITELFDPESGETADDFFDNFFGTELPEDVLDVFGDQFAVSDFIGQLQADTDFESQFGFSEFVEGLPEGLREGLDLAIELALLGPDGSEADARAAVEAILQSENPEVELFNLVNNETIVDSRLEQLKEDSSEELSPESERAVKNAIRSRLKNSSFFAVDAEIADLGAAGFVEKAEQEQRSATTEIAFEKYEEFLSERGLDPTDEERRLAENSIEGLVALGKSAKEIDESIRRNVGNETASNVVNASNANKARAKELVEQIEVVRAGQSAFTNEGRLSDSERDALCEAIAARLAAGESAEKILSELQLLPSAKYLALIGREAESGDQKANDAEAHQRNAAETDESDTDSAGAKDPNDIIGPDGFGPQRFITGEQRLDYTIRFENIETATAAAQEVFITHPIDSDFDLSTFQLTSFGFGDLRIDIPEGRDRFETLTDLEDSLGLLVEFDAGVDLETGIAKWTFRAIDPQTGDLVSDPFAGFLPPNVVPGEGEGFVSYSVVPAAALVTRTRLDALATIVFDLEAPIDTPPIFNTIDADAPTSQFAALPAVFNSASIPLSWSGNDGQGSGVAHYDVFVSDNGGPFQLFADNLEDTSISFIGQDNHRYDFLVTATDNVGRAENKALLSEAFTTLDINDQPVAVAERVAVLEDTAVDIPVLSNDFDVDGDVLSVSIVGEPAHGTAQVLPDGSVRYVPVSNFNGEDSFIYQIDDGREGTSTATVRISVDPVNDAPIAADDTVAAIEDVSLVFDVRQNDLDVENDALTVRIETQPSQGSLIRNFDGSLTYDPAPDFAGTDVFTYSISDGRGRSEGAFVTIDVAARNDAPRAESETVDSLEDQVVTVAVLSNDVDLDGDSLHAEIVRQPANGSATIDLDGAIVYTPEPDFFGTDVVVYRAVDPTGAFSIATLDINVANVNDAPTVADPISNQSFDEDAPPQVIDLAGVFADIDTSGLTLDASSSDEALLTVGLVGTQLTLTLTPDASGEATVTLTADDGELSANSSFLVSVKPINDAPFVVSPVTDQTVDEDNGATVIDLAGVFADIDSGELSLSVVSGDESLVSATILGTQLIFETVPDANGTTLVTVTANDGELEVANAFSVTVSPINDAPIVVSPVSNQFINEDAPPQVIDLDGVFADIDSSGLILDASSSNEALLTVGLVGTQLTLTLIPDASGEAAVSLTADDGELSANSSFLVSVAPLNDAPFVVSPIADQTVDEDNGTTVIDLAGVFADIDSSDLNVSVVSSDESLVSATIEGTQLTFETVPDANGTTLVTVTATDGELESSDTFSVTLLPINDAPVVVTPIQDISVTQDSAAQSIDLSGSFGDVDSTDLTFSAITADESLVATSLDGETLNLSFEAGVTGATTISVTASDGELSVSHTFVVTILPASNDPVQLVDGVLRIQGDQDDRSNRDLIRLRRRHGSLVVQMKWGRASTEFFEFDEELVDRVVVNAGEGNDRVSVHHQIDLPIFVDGGGGNDLIHTAGGDDEIIDLQGHNLIISGQGDDLVSTGSGHDTIYTDGGDDRIEDSGGNNWIWSGRGDDFIQTGAGNDRIFSGRGDDLVLAGDGRNRVWSGDGDDLVISGSGRDLIWGGNGNDAISSGDGNDWVDGGRGDDLIIAGAGRDFVDGASGRDLVVADGTVDQSDPDALDQALEAWLDSDIESAIASLGDILNDDDDDHVINAWLF
ncbi:MAG: tandem-95 repeat protein [Planctomycetota bacterium]